MDHLEIIYEDPYLVAVNKPHGLFTHRSSLSGKDDFFALQILRDQLGRKVYPVHRIDRKTGGVQIFALDKTTLREAQLAFSQRKVNKSYWAIVRGYTPDSGGIDYPLKNHRGTLQEATTCYKTLCRTELPVPFGKFETSRYSLVEVYPHTGRTHQIRKHFSHIFHPIVGDRPHGCNKQNRLFKEKWNMNTMLLHALKYDFIHPVFLENVTIEAKPQSEFVRMMKLMSWNEYITLS